MFNHELGDGPQCIDSIFLFLCDPPTWTDRHQSQGARKNPTTTTMIMSKAQATSKARNDVLYQISH